MYIDFNNRARSCSFPFYRKYIFFRFITKIYEICAKRIAMGSSNGYDYVTDIIVIIDLFKNVAIEI